MTPLVLGVENQKRTPGGHSLVSQLAVTNENPMQSMAMLTIWKNRRMNHKPFLIYFFPDKFNRNLNFKQNKVPELQLGVTQTRGI